MDTAKSVNNKRTLYWENFQQRYGECDPSNKCRVPSRDKLYGRIKSDVDDSRRGWPRQSMRAPAPFRTLRARTELRRV